MKLKVMAFGIARDILGSAEVDFDLPENSKVGDLKEHLLKQFPAFAGLRHLAVAVNCEYAEDEVIFNAMDEVVIIPPVSGG
ncbi:MAG: MoaD/ThiS family protein [Saprospiraceae bacterium]|nr:MoaD/ThiS family protein [Saprospiraceae bacterium]